VCVCMCACVCVCVWERERERERFNNTNSNTENVFLFLCVLFNSFHLSTFPLSRLCNPLKAIARGFFVLFHVSIWSPSTIFPHLHLLHSTPSPTSAPHTVPILQSCLSLLIFKLMFKGVS
jgi:hypothetical protein